MESSLDTNDVTPLSGISNTTVMARCDSVVAETLPQPENQSLNDSNSSECKSSVDETIMQVNPCVNSQAMDSSSSDEIENDDYLSESDDGDRSSEVSELSDFSQEAWQPVQGPISWVQEQMRQGQSPQKILADLVPPGTKIPKGLDPITLWKIIISIISEPPKRKKLEDVNTLEDVLHLLRTRNKIIVLTGAGVSVSCGIPDFRSRDGVYARLAKDFPNLPDPQAMFDIHFFRSDPRPFFKFAKEIYPGQFKPSPCHHFIRLLEEKGKLLRNYTQNIDTLEQVAEIQRVVQCHGSFATASCTVCGHKVHSDEVKKDIFDQVIPKCTRCLPSDQSAVMKPDIVFFGESLPEHFHNQMAADRDECDLLIVIGSSLKVRPVALIPNSLPASVPQILINKERLSYFNFDVELLGNCDDIIGKLCHQLGPGWEELAASRPILTEVSMSSFSALAASYSSDECLDRNKKTSSPEPKVVSCQSTCEPSFHKSKDGEGLTSSVVKICENCVTSEVLHPENDSNEIQEMSFTQTETSLTETHMSHRNSQEQPSVLASSSTMNCSPKNILGSHSSEANEICSSEATKTNVDVSLKEDFIYKKSPVENQSDHRQYSDNINNSQISDHTCHPALGEHCHNDLEQRFASNCHKVTSLHDNCEHCSCLSKSSREACRQREVPAFPGNEETGKSEEKSHTNSKNLQLTDPNKRVMDDEHCQETKKPRLYVTKECTGGILPEVKDALNVEDSKKCDLLLHEGLTAKKVKKMLPHKYGVSLAQHLTDTQVLFLPPSRYVFKGAEITWNSENEDSDDDDDDDDDNDESSSDDGDSMVAVLEGASIAAEKKP